MPAAYIIFSITNGFISSHINETTIKSNYQNRKSNCQLFRKFRSRECLDLKMRVRGCTRERLMEKKFNDIIMCYFGHYRVCHLNVMWIICALPILISIFSLICIFVWEIPLANKSILVLYIILLIDLCACMLCIVQYTVYGLQPINRVQTHKMLSV